MSTSRRNARETALQVLCFWDANPELDPDKAFELFASHLTRPASTTSAKIASETSIGEADKIPSFAEDPEAYDPRRLSPDAQAYADALVDSVVTRRAEIDALISESSKKWRVARMAKVERNVLRLAVAELQRGDKKAPRQVVINEAIELTKKFGTVEAKGFVNGVLDSIANRLLNPSASTAKDG